MQSTYKSRPHTCKRQCQLSRYRQNNCDLHQTSTVRQKPQSYKQPNLSQLRQSQQTSQRQASYSPQQSYQQTSQRQTSYSPQQSYLPYSNRVGRSIDYMPTLKKKLIHTPYPLRHGVVLHTTRIARTTSNMSQPKNNPSSTLSHSRMNDRRVKRKYRPIERTPVTPKPIRRMQNLSDKMKNQWHSRYKKVHTSYGKPG